MLVFGCVAVGSSWFGASWWYFMRESGWGKTNFLSNALYLDTSLGDHRMKAAWDVMAKAAQQDPGVSQILKNQVTLQHDTSAFCGAPLIGAFWLLPKIWASEPLWFYWWSSQIWLLCVLFSNMTTFCPVKHYIDTTGSMVREIPTHLSRSWGLPWL